MKYRRVTVAAASYFFTVVTERRMPILATQESVGLLYTAIEKVRSRHPFELDAQVILPDHVHSIWTLPDGDSNYSTRWRLIKEAFTRSWLRINPTPMRSESRRRKCEQAIWQRQFWEHTIRNDDDYAKHVEYIHANPVQRLVSAVADWPYSTFHDWERRGVYALDWGADDARFAEWIARYE